jgi:DNA-binding HxlR family transcriptional regulator
MTEPTSANEIRKNIRESLRQLLDLQEQGRIVMTQDRYNADWPDSATALTEAIAGLEHAMDAMYCMETLPHPHSATPSSGGEHPDPPAGE